MLHRRQPVLVDAVIVGIVVSVKRQRIRYDRNRGIGVVFGINLLLCELVLVDEFIEVNVILS